MEVIKRDGTIVEFNKSKIETALSKAGLNDTKDIEYIINLVINAYNKINTLSVSDIQTIVENGLMELKHFNIARDYISYRYLHDVAREKYTKLLDTIEDKLFVKDRKNQNANVDEESFGGRVGETSDAIMSQYALDYCMSEKSKYNHVNNIIYIHDLSSYPIGNHNCLSIPFDDLLANGFNTRQTDVRAAQSVSTAFQLVAVIFQLQSLQQFGGVAATHIDWTMIPYVRKSFNKHFRNGLKYIDNKNEDTIKYYKNINVVDISIEDKIYKKYPSSYKYAMDMTIKEIEQSVEGMYHNLNTLQSRSGNQLPFSSINYGTCTVLEGRLITKALLEKSIEGVGKLHKTSIFPK